MQTEQLSNAREKVNHFLRKRQYVILVSLLTAVSFMLGGELVLYTLFAAIAVYVAIWGEDLLPIMPWLACGYIAPSVANNPGRNTQSVFSGATGTYIIVLGAIIVASILAWVIRNRKTFFSSKNKLLSGLLVLSGAYLLGGIGHAGYGAVAIKHILFALVQALAITMPYWLFSSGVNWKKVQHQYFAWIGVCAGCVLLLELLWIYLTGDIIVDGVILRTKIYTGWGMYNNVGGMLAMMIPFVCYLAFTYRKGRLAILAGLVFLLGVAFTCSRTSMLVAVASYAACCILMVFFGKRRRRNAYMTILVTALVVGSFLLFHKQIILLFSQILDDVHEMESRFEIYHNGINEFLKNPIFGASFYPAEGLSWSWSTTDITEILPARWHNTYIQLLASTGIVGMLAYLLHRYQTIRMCLKLEKRKQVLIVFSALTLLACSMTDCHFFNIGPTLFYSMLLAWLEKQHD